MGWHRLYPECEAGGYCRTRFEIFENTALLLHNQHHSLLGRTQLASTIYPQNLGADKIGQRRNEKLYGRRNLIGAGIPQ